MSKTQTTTSNRSSSQKSSISPWSRRADGTFWLATASISAERSRPVRAGYAVSWARIDPVPQPSSKMDEAAGKMALDVGDDPGSPGRRVVHGGVVEAGEQS